jgi:hypothetical protein
MAVNKSTLNYFGLSTLLGFNLTNHSGGFIEYAPPSPLRDIYLKYRAQRMSESGGHSFTIFEAANEMQEQTGLSPTDLSRELARISVNLFIAHPILYASSVARAWWSFWAVPNYWRLNQFSDAVTATQFQRAWRWEQLVLRAMNLLFVVGACALAAIFVFRRPPSSRTLIFLGVLASVVLSASLGQAIVEYGENPRYSVPTQPLVLCFVLTGAWLVGRLWRGRTGKSVSASHEAPSGGR